MSNAFKDWYADFSDEQKKNYELCMKYPILVPKNAWMGEEFEDYDYEYTMLNHIEDGWRIAFGEEWAKEIQEAINKIPDEDRDKVYIIQLKEKFGRFRQYFSYYTDELDTVVHKYEELSKRICIKCGKPATKININWISPYCDDCINGFNNIEFMDINEYYGGENNGSY